MLPTKFLADVYKELTGEDGGGLIGRKVVFETKLAEIKSTSDKQEKDISYFGQVAGFAHRLIRAARSGREDAEAFDIMLIDPQARLTKNSTSESWILHFAGNTYLGTLRLE